MSLTASRNPLNARASATTTYAADTRRASVHSAGAAPSAGTSPTSGKVRAGPIP